MENGQGFDLKLSQLLQNWLEELQKNIRPTSFVMYQSHVNHYLCPLLGDLSLTELSPSAGKKLDSDLKKLGLSAKTAKDILGKFNQALRWGADQGYDIPLLQQPFSFQSNKNVRILSTEEELWLEAYLSSASETLRNGITLALRAGLTIGELCAVSWEDFDVKKRKIRVHQICQRAPNGLVYEEINERVVPLPVELHLRDGNSEKGFFLRSTRGGAAEPRLCQFWLKSFLNAYHLPLDITFAVFRNTYIKNLMESGMDFIEISRHSGCKNLNDLWQRFGRFYQGNLNQTG